MLLVEVQFNIMTGAVVSLIITVLVTIFPVFPAASIFLYVKIYVPIIHVFTDPLVGTAMVQDPSTASVHVDHDSL